MTPEGSRPFQATELEDVEQVGWTAASALLNAQETGNRALENFLLLMNFRRSGILDAADVEILLEDAIQAHAQIIEDLELARDALDELEDGTADPT